MNNIQKKETRVLQNQPVTLRNMPEEAGGEKRIISGTGIVFNQPSQVLTDWKRDQGIVAFREIIMPEAVENIDWSNVVSCFNHRDDLLLGTGYAGTARYTVTASGVDYEIDAPDTDYANNLIDLLKRGDIRGSSFIFISNDDKDTWTLEADGTYTRRVYEFSGVYEMGPVFGEAYRQTTANYRSYEKHVLEAENKPEEFTKDQMALDQLECLSIQLSI